MSDDQQAPRQERDPVGRLGTSENLRVYTECVSHGDKEELEWYRAGAHPHMAGLVAENERLRGAIRSIADDNSPHDAQRIAENYVDKWDSE